MEKRGPSITTMVPPSMHVVAGGADQRRAQVGAVRVGEGRVRRAGVDVGLDPRRGAVDELVGHDEGAGLGLRLQATDRAGREHLATPRLRSAQRFAR